MIKVQEDKPAITFKLDEGAAAVSDKTEPKTDEVVVKDKTVPKTDELKVQEDKPAITSKLSNDSPKEDKSMLISDEQIEQAEQQQQTSNYIKT